MAIDITGLLTGVLSPEQRATAKMNEGLALAQLEPGRAALAYAPGRAAQATGGLSRLLGVDARQPEQRVMDRVMPLLQSGDPAQVAQAVPILQEAGMSDLALQLQGRVNQEQERLALAEQSRLQEQAAREALSAQATRLGLTSLAEQAQSPYSDIQALSQEIREEERRRVVAQGGRPSKLALARRAGVDLPIIQGIARGDYDDLEPADFLSFIEGDEADTRPFLNSSGQVQIFKVSESGNVWNTETGRWEAPSQLGLSAAPVRTENLEVANRFQEGATEQAVTNFDESFEGAQSALSSLQNTSQSLDLIDAGINSGAFANFETGLTSALMTLGVVDPAAPAAERVRNTQAYVARRAEEVGQVIRLFGAGTGLSDADREYAQQIVAGSIPMTEGAMRRVLAMSKIANTNIIREFNRDLDEKVELNRRNPSEGLSEDAASYFRLPEPAEIPVEYAAEWINGEAVTFPVYEIRPGQWVRSSGIPYERGGR